MKTILATLLLVAGFSAFATQSDSYFRQFLYQEEIDNTDPEQPTTMTRYVMTEYNKRIVLPSGEKLNPSMSLFLLPDNKFVAYYRENLFPKDSDTNFFPRGCKKIEGVWSVPQDKLILPGIGYAEKLVHEGQNAINVVVTEQIISAEAVGLKTIGHLGFSNTTIDQQFCF